MIIKNNIAQGRLVSTKKIIIYLFILIIGGIASYNIFDIRNPRFENLSASAMYDRIIDERNFAINKAKEDGNYRCCIEPACTMCYMKANEWNNYTPGTCACDDLIAEGKEPCPQCGRGDTQNNNEEAACGISKDEAICEEEN